MVSTVTRKLAKEVGKLKEGRARVGGVVEDVVEEELGRLVRWWKDVSMALAPDGKGSTEDGSGIAAILMEELKERGGRDDEVSAMAGVSGVSV